MPMSSKPTSLVCEFIISHFSTNFVSVFHTFLWGFNLIIQRILFCLFISSMGIKCIIAFQQILFRLPSFISTNFVCLSSFLWGLNGGRICCLL